MKDLLAKLDELYDGKELIGPPWTWNKRTNELLASDGSALIASDIHWTDARIIAELYNSWPEVRRYIAALEADCSHSCMMPDGSGGWMCETCHAPESERIIW